VSPCTTYGYFGSPRVFVSCCKTNSRSAVTATGFNCQESSGTAAIQKRACGEVSDRGSGRGLVPVTERESEKAFQGMTLFEKATYALFSNSKWPHSPTCWLRSRACLGKAAAAK